MTIDDAEMKQDEFDSILDSLSNFTPKAQKYIEAKNNLLDNAKNFYEGREKTIEGFQNGIFLLNLMMNLKNNRLVKKNLLINQQKLILMN